MGTVNEGGAERRTRQRYPLRMPLLCKIPGRGSKSILGETVDISSGGVLFIAAEPIPCRTRLEILIDWPVARHGGALKLVLLARTIRCDANRVAVEIQSHRLLESGAA
jgi:PilZ domain-containing protein